jgi:hypothetical protein
MEAAFDFFPWLGFVGGWLLFAGPIYQAAIELHEQSWDSTEEQDVHARASALAPPPRTSAWWWLLPPVAYVLNSRRSRAWRSQVFLLLTLEQRERYIAFSNKAAGWLIVAMGASLLAVKETAEIVERQEWPAWVIAPMIVVPFALSVGYTVARMFRTRQFEQELHVEVGPPTGPTAAGAS